MGILDKASVIHVIGAGGIGVSAVARLLKHHGKDVTGSDSGSSETVEELRAAGIPVAVGHRDENLPANADLVVYSGAVPPTNPERSEATRRGIRQLSYFEFVGAFSAERRTVAVSGTNGKSSTTAMLGLMLERGGLDPTVIVGSKVPTFPNKNLRLGNGELFVVEGCEHEANILKLSPWMIVLTNIEADHLDFYRDIEHIRSTFNEYVRKLPADGKLVLNADDSVSVTGLAPVVPVITYGMNRSADYMARNVIVGEGMQTFEVVRREVSLGEFTLHVPGKFNVMNALAAITAALELGAPVEQVRASLADYQGIWRRFERVGELPAGTPGEGAIVISDYGHHPTAVAGTLVAARSFYPNRRIVLAFQPHHRNRTRNLFTEFVASFDGADVLLLPEIFDVSGRDNATDAAVSSQQLVDAVKKRDDERGVFREVVFTGTIPETLTAIENRLQPNDLLLLVGAGNIYTLAKKLVQTSDTNTLAKNLAAQ